MKSKLFLTLLSVAILFPLVVAFAPHDDPDSVFDSIANAAPAGSGGNGPFTAENIFILGHLPLDEVGGGSANVLGSDCWGWTDSQTGKEYALVCLTNATSFVDISDPTDPLFLGRLLTQTGNSAWRDVKVYDDHAFIVSDGNDDHGMQVFDLTQLRTADPNNPQVFSNSALYTGVGSSHNIAINEETGFAYIIGSNRADGGIHAVDIQNPLNPVEAGNYADAGYCHDAQVVTYAGPDPDYLGREIAICCNGRSQSDNDAVVIVDVTNKSNMTLISSNSYPEPGFCHQGWLSDDHRYFYLGDEFDEQAFGGGTRLIIFDCLDLDNPVYVGTYQGTTNAVDHNVFVRGDKIYVANYAAGMRVLQMAPTDPTNLNEIASVDTFMQDNDTDFDGAWASFPYFPSGVVIINDRQNGMFAVRVMELAITLPNGHPEEIASAGQVEFQVAVEALDGMPSSGTGTLHVDRGNGFEEFPMAEVSPNLYDAVFPATDCGSGVNYFVSVTSTNGIQECFPSDAPTTFFSSTIVDAITETFEDNFQTNQGWAVSGDAPAGQWERGVPAGDGTRGDPTVDGDESGQCYLTENGPGNTDIDDGTTVLTSPVMDAVGNGNAVSALLSYYRWYSNDVGNSPASDIFVIEISNDNGMNWVELETVGPGGNEVSGSWFQKTFAIEDFVTPTDQMRVRFTASDLGDGSVVEAAVDGIAIELIECEDDVLHGDVNMDGAINLLDVDPFITILSAGDFQAEADINKDGVVNLLDVQGFIDLLGGGG